MIAAFIDIFAGMEDCERMKNYCATKSPSVSRRTLLQSTYVLDKVAVDNQEGNNTASTTQESKMTSGIAVGVHHAPVLINGSWRPYWDAALGASWVM
jgi:hypothetical protein